MSKITSLLQDLWRRRAVNDQREDIDAVEDLAWSVAPLCELSPAIQAHLFKLIHKFLWSGTLLMYAGLESQQVSEAHGIAAGGKNGNRPTLREVKSRARQAITEADPGFAERLERILDKANQQMELTDLPEIHFHIVGLSRLLTSLKAIDGAPAAVGEGMVSEFEEMWDDMVALSEERASSAAARPRRRRAYDDAAGGRRALADFVA